MLRISKHGSYAVPVIMKALDVMELLERVDGPLKMDEISLQAGVPRSTTYRILRTLVQRRYVLQLPDGAYQLMREAKATPAVKTASTTKVRRIQRPDTMSEAEAISIVFGLIQRAVPELGASYAQRA